MKKKTFLIRAEYTYGQTIRCLRLQIKAQSFPAALELAANEAYASALPSERITLLSVELQP